MPNKCIFMYCINKRVVMYLPRVKNMYIADLESIEGDDLSCLSCQTDDADLWH